jgi:PAS domain S-box-containing protein
MKEINNNIIQSIFSFNYLNLHSSSPDEIINKGLHLYSELANCRDVSLFLVDSKSFELNFYSSTNFEFVRETISLFDSFTEDGSVSQAIISGEIVEREIVTNNEIQYFQIIPLNIPNGIVGIVILRNPFSIDSDKLIKFYLTGFSINFALLIEISFKDYIINQNKSLSEMDNSPLSKVGFNLLCLKSILDSVQAGLLIIDKASSKILMTNNKSANLIEVEEEVILNSKMSDFFMVQSSIKKLDEFSSVYEALIHKNNGSIVPIQIRESNLIFDEVDLVIYSFIDISEKKQKENELQKAHFLLEHRIELRTEELADNNSQLLQEVKYRENAESQLLKFMWAVEQSPTAILILELSGIIQYANKKYIDLTGSSQKEILGSKPVFINAIGMNLKQINFDTVLVNGGQLWNAELKNIRKNGEEYWTSLYITPITDLSGKVTNLLCLLEDITEKKKVVEELVSAKLSAEQSNNLKTYLLGNMSHEFRTPLISILGFTQILNAEITNDEYSTMIQFIHQSGERLLKTLDGMLQLSDLETKKTLNNTVKIDFEKIVDVLADKYIDRIQDKGVDLRIKANYNQIFFYSDAELLQICIEHIFDNAVKFTNKGAITLSAQIISSEQNKYVEIKIIDTGIGIAAEKIEHIFNAFTQADEGLTRSYEGVGLGLTIAKRIVELLEGNLLVTSEVDKGSEFVIKFPIIPSTFRKQLVG